MSAKKRLVNKSMLHLDKYKRQAAGGFIALICTVGLLPHPAQARVTVPIISQTPGRTPFIENITVDISGENGGSLGTVAYVITPKPGSYTRRLLDLIRRVISPQTAMSTATVSLSQ